jgi:L-aspartate oxidase
MQPHVLILGTGIAGLSCALKYAAAGVRVSLVSKALASEGSTRYAQGGIASVWSSQDSFEAHQRDTLAAGAGLCHPEIVQICVQEGPARVQELIDWGVQFTKMASDRSDVPGGYDLHREGGHTERRILHADDLTGLAIENALLAEVRKSSEITLLENHAAIDLITEGKLFRRWRKPGRVLGAYVLDSSGHVITITADLTVLATGGAGKVYLYTTNPDTATGDGIAMGYRAGARVANLEFIQFHPTCLYHPEARTYLITEAIRGEGAILKNLAGESFMEKFHPLASLAPRDIVSRSIDIEMKRTGDKHVWLDATAIGDRFAEHFPNIFERLISLGIDPRTQMIPVVPGAHYTCGGVQTDENALTSIDGLYAIGEVACTGLHGANRLASNSLLEGVVFAHRAVAHGLQALRTSPAARSPVPAVPAWDVGPATPLEEQIDIAANWLEIRSLMWNYVGIVRSNRRLERAKRRLELLKAEIQAYYWNHLLTRDLIELRNLITVAELIVQCASLRRESRGLHATVDYPPADPQHLGIDTVV